MICERAFATRVLTLLLVCVTGAVIHGQDIVAEPARRADPPPLCLARGHHDVGFAPFAFNEAGYLIEGGIWYPAQQVASATPRVIYFLEPTDHRISALCVQRGMAVDHAEIDSASGPYPLVVAVYENVGQIYANAYLHELLVSRGFIVIAVMHPFDNLPRHTLEPDRSYRMLNTMDSLNNTSLKKEAVIGYVLDVTAFDGFMSGMVDFHRVAFVEMFPPRSSKAQDRSSGNCGMTGREDSSTTLSPGC